MGLNKHVKQFLSLWFPLYAGAICSKDVLYNFPASYNLVPISNFHLTSSFFNAFDIHYMN
jgi:hypothetical protein